MKREETFGHPERGRAAQRYSVPFVRRQEDKFEIERASALFLRQEIARHLPVFEFKAGYPDTYITTVYYDTRDRSFYRQAERSYDDNVKIRVKEYCHQRIEGQNRLFECPPHCYVELKQRDRGTVIKRRVPLPKEDLSRLFRGEDVWDSILRLNGDARTPALEGAYGVLRRYLQRYEVFGTSIISYRRRVYQRSEEQLRITFDDSVAVFDALTNVYESMESLNPDNLGQPIRRYEKEILEIKCPSRQYPEWLQRALRHHVAKRLSKFTTSVRYLTDSDPQGPGPRDVESPVRPIADPAVDSASDDTDDTSIVNRPIES